MKKIIFMSLLFISSNLFAQTDNEIEGVWYSDDIKGYFLIRVVNNTVLVIDLDRKSPRAQALEGVIENPGIEYFSYIGEISSEIGPAGLYVQSLKSGENGFPESLYSNHTLYFNFNSQNNLIGFGDCSPVCSCPSAWGGLIEKVF